MASEFVRGVILRHMKKYDDNMELIEQAIAAGKSNKSYKNLLTIEKRLHKEFLVLQKVYHLGNMNDISPLTTLFPEII